MELPNRDVEAHEPSRILSSSREKGRGVAMSRFLKRLFGRALERDVEGDDGFGWMMPPTTLVDPAPWDQYWHDQLSHGVADFVHLFCDDGDLVDVMRASGLKTVLCCGNGISQEP